MSGPFTEVGQLRLRQRQEERSSASELWRVGSTGRKGVLEACPCETELRTTKILKVWIMVVKVKGMVEEKGILWTTK